MEIHLKIANELNATPQQVSAAIQLLDQGATVPFIARYRKEVTGGLDDAQLRILEERLSYLRELESRRAMVIESIRGQGKLTPELELSIRAADTKARLEDLYLPYKPKRRTKAQIAREAGLEPLATALWQNPDQSPEALAENFALPDKGVADGQAALEGARQILMERFSEDADLTGALREEVWRRGILSTRTLDPTHPEAQKFRDYLEYHEPIARIPPHRALALFRGQKLGILALELMVDEETPPPSLCEARIARHFGIEYKGRPADDWLRNVVHRTWKVKLFPRIDLDLKTRLRETAEEAAIGVFATNLKDLLLSAPAGHHTIMGLDPGLRTGVKVALIDPTGKVLDTDTIYPHPPRNQWDISIEHLAGLIRKHRISLVGIGNGTASRETEKLVRDLVKRYPGLKLRFLMVSEAGASVYSASALASAELPQLDVSLRGAVSIARRLQDPLAELVKIAPKAIGVGQYQHDVNQSRLVRSLDNVVEDCVNAVGVEVNTASPALLQRVAGLNAALAQNIVSHRNEHGPFRVRRELLQVPRLGPKTFEQAAGFLRIRGGDDPLDASAVHPEAYDVVERIARKHGRKVASLIGDSAFLRRLDPSEFTDQIFGLPTVRDILAELEKPGRDPRPEFRTAAFQEGVETLEDLKPGMILEGVVTNVTDFGAFVDIGVHQNGLVHISAMTKKFVGNPRDVAKTGDLVKVKVMATDLPRRRISLSMRLDDEPRQSDPPGSKHTPEPQAKQAGGKRRARKPAGIMAQALDAALKK